MVIGLTKCIETQVHHAIFGVEAQTHVIEIDGLVFDDNLKAIFESGFTLAVLFEVQHGFVCIAVTDPLAVIFLGRVCLRLREHQNRAPEQSSRRRRTIMRA